MTTARVRVISDNDYSGDPDGLVQLAHHLLSPSVELRLVIGSHLAPGDPFDPSDRTADNAAVRAREVADAIGADVVIVTGANRGLTNRTTPQPSAAATAIVNEAMRDDPRPLFVTCGAGLTEIASAWLREPRIADRLTLVWIGGSEYPGTSAPPRAPAVEYNTAIDPIAAQVVFEDSPLRIWQVPRDAYRQTLLSTAELNTHIRPHGPIGALLADAIDRVADLADAHGFPLGETYVYGDSPLVLLTALQSSFEADPSSSRSEMRRAPRVADDGRFLFGSSDGRPVRVFTRLDTRLMFGDLSAKLAAAAAR